MDLSFADHMSDGDLRKQIEEMTSSCDDIEYENTVLESYVIRIFGESDITISEEDIYAIMVDLANPSQATNANASLSTLDISNLRPAERSPRTGRSNASISSRRSKTTSISSSQGQHSHVMLKLNNEQKGDIVDREIDEIAVRVKKIKQQADRTMDDFKCVKQQAEAQLTDTKKTAQDFQRDMDSNLNKRTKKYPSEKVLKFFDEKRRSKEALVKKCQLKTASVTAQARKVHLQLKQKEEMGDVLHQVDFDQLKIENQQYLEKIDEKNRELLVQKQKATNCTVKLNKMKETVQRLDTKNQHLANEIKVRSEAKKRLTEERSRAEVEVASAKKSLGALRDKLAEYDVPETREYVQQKIKLDEMRHKASIWMRKLEITEMKLKTVASNWRVMCRKQSASSSANISAAVTPKLSIGNSR